MKVRKIILAHVFCLTVFPVAFSYAFVYTVANAVQSVFLILLLYAVSLLVGALIYEATKLRPVFYELLHSLLMSLLTGFLLLIYVLNCFSNSLWRTNTTLNFLIESVVNINYFDMSAATLTTIIMLCLVVFISFLWWGYFQYRKELRWISVFLGSTSLIDSELPVRFKLSFFVFVLILMAGVWALLVALNPVVFDDDIWAGEPITDFFNPYVMITGGKSHRGFSAPVSYDGVEKKIGISQPNVILIVVDDLRADHMGAYGYSRNTTPYINSLVSSGNAKKVKQAFSTCSESYCGIVSILSSRPHSEIHEKNKNLHGVLKSAGYEVRFIMSADHSWSGLDNNYQPADMVYDGRSFPRHYSAVDDRGVVEKVKEIADFNSPAFFYFHLMSTHLSSQRQPEFNLYRPNESVGGWLDVLPFASFFYDASESKRERIVNSYDNGVVESDFRIKEILTILEKKGYLSNSVIWITSDHGEALGEHGHFGHIKSLYQEEINIPMIIIDPQLSLYKELDVASHIDVAPTILDRLGIKPPSEWKGRSLLVEEKGEVVTFHATPFRDNKKAVVMYKKNEYMYKAIFNGATKEVLELYDLKKDLGEVNNVINHEEHEALVQKIKGLIS